MRIILILIASLFLLQPAYADVVEVPLLSDGTVNLDEVLPTLSFAFPIYEDGSLPTDFTGEILGEPFAGRVIDVDSKQGFTLAIDAPTHSEHGNFLIAVLATDVICLRGGSSPGLVLWKDAKKRAGTIWEVSTFCTSFTE